MPESLPLLRFRIALHCGYSGIIDIQYGLIFFVLTRARTFKKARENIQCFHSGKHSMFSFEDAIFISDTTITTMQSATKT
jgi:hypothetical protein